MAQFSDRVATRIKARLPIGPEQDPHTLAYRTQGGSYLIASNGRQSDDRRPHDLMLIMWDDTVIVLSPALNPDLLAQVEALVAGQ